MTLLEWSRSHPEETPVLPGAFEVMLLKRVWGTIIVHANDEYEAKDIVGELTIEEAEARVDWDDENTEYEVESCYGVHRVE